MNRNQRPAPVGDPYADNQIDIAKANAYLLKRCALCASVNTAVLAIISPFLDGFSGAAWLYAISAALTGLYNIYCYKWLDRKMSAVLPLFYCLLAGFCGYAIALSCFFYPDIHGVTIIGIFMLVPMVILDRTWRVNTIFFAFFAISCVFTLLKKPIAIATDDCLTSGAFMVFGMLIGNYLRNARLMSIEQQRLLEIQRDIDALTGLPNRRVLFETLARIDAGDGEKPVGGMIMIDIDDFKRYNDINGHLAGDECLRKLCAFFLDFAEETGITIYRYGGEEFLGLWRSGDNIDAEALACRLVMEVINRDITGDGVTVSAGYVKGVEGVNTERLISFADSALYEAKRLGKARAVGCDGASGALSSPTPRQKQ